MKGGFLGLSIPKFRNPFANLFGNNDEEDKVSAGMPQPEQPEVKDPESLESSPEGAPSPDTEEEKLPTEQGGGKRRRRKKRKTKKKRGGGCGCAAPLVGGRRKKKRRTRKKKKTKRRRRR